MTYGRLQRLLPRILRRYILDFEARIEDAVAAAAARLPGDARVLDAGAGEGQYAPHFERRRYFGVDLAIGDAGWNYRGLDAVADLAALPFPAGAFDLALNIVTLEHVPDPRRVVSELSRVLRPGGELLLVVPLEWEEHQTPHDYFRYTQFGVRRLLADAGLEVISLDAAGGFFRLLARRCLNALQFFPGPLVVLGALLFAPAGLLLPLLEPLDRRRNFTLGYICTARKPG